jgi:hypothetical protein
MNFRMLAERRRGGATETNFFNRAGREDTKLGASEKDDADCFVVLMRLFLQLHKIVNGNRGPSGPLGIESTVRNTSTRPYSLELLRS